MRQTKSLNQAESRLKRNRSLPIKIALSLGVLVSCSALVFVSRAHNQPVSKVEVLKAAASTQSQPEVKYREMVRIFVHGDDIYPGFARVRPGRVLLRAENETQSDVALILERVVSGETRQSVARVATSGRGKRADNEVALDIGEYVFFEESRPEIQGRLIVEPR
ncbi:MAG: hypothetical protein WAU45_04660 [Blastocatellia bacterium]